jgi:hypothetical protein
MCWCLSIIELKGAVFCMRGHSAKHGHHGTIPNTISRVKIFIFHSYKLSIHNAAEVGCYLVTTMNFGQIGLMCTKVVSHHTTMFIPLELYHLA